MGDQNGFAEWGGYMDAKVTKLEEQFAAASGLFRKSNLFAGISIFVNGLTNPSADELKRMMMMHGGTFHHYERSHTTYIIASNLPDVKVRNMDTSKIISAKWVVDCLAAKRILDYTQYLLYTNQKTSQPRLDFGKKTEKSESVFSNKLKSEKVAMILEDLGELKGHMRASFIEEDKKIDFNGNMASKQPNTMQINGANTGNSTARTAVDPNFLPEFYNNSRLHHIATLGAGFKQYINELREKHVDSIGFPARTKLRQQLNCEAHKSSVENVATDSTCIMHIDMDCFFVSVGLRKHPHLRGQPVAVTHSKGGSSASDVPVHPEADRKVEMELFAKRFEDHLHNNILADKVRTGFDAKMSLSEIASCSYEAREKGVRNGMFVGRAIKLCPELKTIPYDFEGYKEVAFTLYDTIAQYTLQIEAVSCDELYVDLSEIIQELKITPMDFARIIREEVRQKTGCPCSAGIGANKLQARMATKRAKPDGQYYLESNNVEAYMADILVEELPGVGSRTNYILKNAGCITCGDLQRLTLTKIQSLVGKKHGETLFEFCRGIDNRPLAVEQTRKSVSAEINYGIRFKETAELEKFLRQLCEEVHSRLCQIKRKTKCVTLKVMVRNKDAPTEPSKFMGHGVCDYITKSVPLNEFTNDIELITRTVLNTMKNLNVPPNELRGIGIQLTKLDEPKTVPKENIIKNMFVKLREKRKEEDKVTLELGAKRKVVNTEELPPTEPVQRKRFNVLGEKAMFQSTPRDAAINSDFEDEVTLEPATKRKSLNTDTKKGTERDVPGYIEIIRSSPTKEVDRESPDVYTILQSANLKKLKPNVNTSKTDKVKLPSYIDVEVFESLPLKMREEILDELAYQSKQSTPLGISLQDKNDVNELDDQPSTSRAALERRAVLHLYRGTESNFLKTNNAGVQESNDSSSAHPIPSENNIFLQPNCNLLFLEWVKSDKTPKEHDVKICCDHACELIRANRLIELYAPLMHLRKVIESKHPVGGDSPWYMAYFDILDAVHHERNLLNLGRKFLTPDTKL